MKISSTHFVTSSGIFLLCQGETLQYAQMTMDGASRQEGASIGIAALTALRKHAACMLRTDRSL